MYDIRDYIRRMTKAASKIDGAYDMLSKKLGIKGNMLWLLYILDDGELHSQKQICEEWLFPKTTINTLIKECQTAGYITLHTIPGQKRAMHIQLTGDGQSYARRMLSGVYEAEEQALRKTLAECSPESLSHFEIYAENLRNAFAHYTDKKDGT